MFVIVCLLDGEERRGEEKEGGGIHMYKILGAPIVSQSIEFLVNPH